MARDKRGQVPEPSVDDALDDMSDAVAGNASIAGPTSRNDIGNTKRAAAKATGTMGASKKIDPDLKIPSVDTVSDGLKKSAGARRARRALDQGSDRADGAAPETVRKTISNAEIAEGVTTTARRSPAPRSAQTDAGFAANPAANPVKRTGGARQRVPAPGNATSTTKRAHITGDPQATSTGRPSTASTGGTKPPKRSARAGHTTAASKNKGSDRGLAD